jgi:hypothetical protein
MMDFKTAWFLSSLALLMLLALAVALIWCACDIIYVAAKESIARLKKEYHVISNNQQK